MEQRPVTPPPPQPPSSTPDRDSTIRPQRFNNLLSASEPSLRFPRPQGNRRLANWVHSSHPDIMMNGASPDQPEESGLLSDSTYEVIHNTDTESQDGFAPSICSSDYLQSDDLHSLVSTENNTNDENEDSEDYAHPDRDGYASEEVGYTHMHNESVAQSRRPVRDDRTDSDGESEPDILVLPSPRGEEPATATQSTTIVRNEEDDSEDDSRRSSIQYTEESLKFPSANTPPPEEEETKPFRREDVMAFVTEAGRAIYNQAHLIIMLFLVATGPFILEYYFALSTHKQANRVEPVLTPVVYTTVSVTTSTVIINHTSTKTILVSTTTTAVSSSTSTSTLLLPSSRPVEKHESKGICSAKLQNPQEILVKIPQGTKLSWLAKDSISIEVARGRDPIKAKFSSVDEGILIEVSKKDAYGVLNVSVVTTRRPKVNETFAVDFGKRMLDQATDFGTEYLSELVETATTMFAEARRLSSQPVNFTVAEDILLDARKFAEKLLISATEEAKNNWQEVKNTWHGVQRFDFPCPPAEWTQKLRDIEGDVELTLLKAQVSARLWWLKAQGKTEEHNNYLAKAMPLVKDRAAAVNFNHQRFLTMYCRATGRGCPEPEKEPTYWGCC